jgi:Na+-driven multidrug efflux pump
LASIRLLTLVHLLLLLLLPGDGVNAVSAAALRGAGRQGLGAGINAVGYW